MQDAIKTIRKKRLGNAYFFSPIIQDFLAVRWR
jgi:hypothetical protein